MRKGINVGAIILVVFLQQVSGFIWYSPFAFGKLWMAAIGKDTEALKLNGAKPYIVSIIGSILMCYVVAKVVSSFEARGFLSGIKVGFLLWIGLVLPVIGVSYFFAAQPFSLIWIDGGYALLNILLAGGILAEIK